MVSTHLKTILNALDTKLSRLSMLASATILTFLALVGALGLHVVLRTIEGQPCKPIATLNAALQIILVTFPIIFYARKVIAEQASSRDRLHKMSCHLARAVEEAQEASRAKSNFLANMSHELRTPLNAILGFSEVIKEQHLGPVHNPRYLGYVADIHASGRHLLGIINDVLDLAKIESGKMSLDSAEAFDLAHSVTEALAMVAGLGEKYGVTVTSALTADGARLMAVERMIRQVLINLVGNAVKFTPQGGVVQVTGGIAADGGYRLTVRDSGVGMNDKEIATALTPFGQNQIRQAIKREGTGLGLPLAKAMLELHDGSLRIESVPGHGTTVIINLPASRLVTSKRAAA